VGSDGEKTKDLQDFSPWLAKFHHFQTQDAIKFPGLYDSLSQPDIDSHPSIVSFDSTVKSYILNVLVLNLYILNLNR
jgi:hypothetical protein